ncbi:MAG: ABC transporter permease [Defluviitaleaceae bacterium]|nr:ABC transporter permease [Defluviitaleaceae bacterium]
MNLTVFNYALRRSLKNPIVLAVNLVLPFAIILFAFDAPSIRGENRGYYILAMILMFGAYLAARGIRDDNMERTVIRILAGPITMRSYLVQNFFSTMLPVTGIIFASVALGTAVHGWEIRFAALLALCYLFLAATSVGLSFAWSCIFNNKETSFAVFSVVLTMVASLGGLFIPLEFLPGPLAYISAIFPPHWAARAIETLLNGDDLHMYFLSLLAMALFATAFLLYGGRRRIL